MQHWGVKFFLKILIQCIVWFRRSILTGSRLLLIYLRLVILAFSKNLGENEDRHSLEIPCSYVDQDGDTEGLPNDLDILC